MQNRHFFFFFFFHWHYSPLWALACQIISFHFSLFGTNSLQLLTPSTLRSLSTSSSYPFLDLPRLALSSSWVKIFLGILSSSIISRCTLPLYPFYYIFSFVHLFWFSICPTFPFPVFMFRTIHSSKYCPFKN
jgi:hypothetical protein